MWRGHLYVSGQIVMIVDYSNSPSLSLVMSSVIHANSESTQVDSVLNATEP